MTKNTLNKKNIGTLKIEEQEKNKKNYLTRWEILNYKNP